MAKLKKTTSHADDPDRLPAGTDRQLRYAWVAERVFLAWVRTGIALIALGFLLARIGMMLEAVAASAADARPLPKEATFTGMVLIAVGCIVSAVSTGRYYRTQRGLREGKPVQHRSDLAYFVGLTTPAVGVALIVFLLRGVVY